MFLERVKYMEALKRCKVLILILYSIDMYHIDIF